MHKLVILVESTAETAVFDEFWPQFLHLAESMPGLVREATSRIDRVLYGQLNCTLMHELFFENWAALQKAMASPQGVQAGQILQRMTQGRVILMLADHKEDEIANLEKYRQAASGEAQPAPDPAPDPEADSS